VADFFFTYQKMSPEEDLQLLREIGTVELTERGDQIMQVSNPWIRVGIREGLAAGREEGRLQGEVELILKLLGRRLGTIQDADKKAVRKLELSKIEDLGEALLQFSTYQDLTRWLRKNKS
jgi:hypothetical protein